LVVVVLVVSKNDCVVADVAVLVVVLVVGSPYWQFHIEEKQVSVPGMYGKHSPSVAHIQGPAVPIAHVPQLTGA